MVGGLGVVVHEPVQVGEKMTHHLGFSEGAFLLSFAVILGFLSCSGQRGTETLDSPSLSVSSGVYDAPVSVSLGHEDRCAWIYYMKDGAKTASEWHTYYGGGILVEEETILSAYAEKGGVRSDVVSSRYLFSFRVVRMAPAPEELQDAQDAGELTRDAGLFLRENFGDILGADAYLSRFSVPEGGEVRYRLSEYQEGEFSVFDGEGESIGLITAGSDFVETVSPGAARYVVALQGSKYYLGAGARFEIRISIQG